MRKPAWTMPADEARTFLEQLQEKIASSEIEVQHRDVLIRLRSIIEEDLASSTESRDKPLKLTATSADTPLELQSLGAT